MVSQKTLKATTETAVKTQQRGKDMPANAFPWLVLVGTSSNLKCSSGHQMITWLPRYPQKSHSEPHRHSCWQSHGKTHRLADPIGLVGLPYQQAQISKAFLFSSRVLSLGVTLDKKHSLLNKKEVIFCKKRHWNSVVVTGLVTACLA